MSHRFGNAADRKGCRNSLGMHIYEGKGNASGILQKMRRCNTKGMNLTHRILFGVPWREGVHHWNRLEGHEGDVDALVDRLAAVPPILGSVDISL